MRAPIMVGMILVGALGVRAEAGKKVKVKAALTCAVTNPDGTRRVLGKGKPRIEGQVNCMLTQTAVADGVAYTANIWTEYTTSNDTGKVSVKSTPRTGSIYYNADWLQALPASFSMLPGGGGSDMPEGNIGSDGSAGWPDFVSCINFVVKASLTDAKGKSVWKTSLKLKQSCPD